MAPPGQRTAGAGPDQAPPARIAASGQLAERPFARLLHQLMRKRVTGQLVVTDPSGDESRVFLREGAPVHVVRPTDADRLDQVVAAAGLVSPEVLRELSAALPEGKRLGEVLVERNLVAEATLADLLKVQMRRKLFRLFHVREGRFEVHLDAHRYGAGSEFVEMRVDPRCLVLDGIRSAYDLPRLQAELAPLAGRRFRLLGSVPASLLEAMGFPAADPTVARLGSGSHTLGDFPPAGVPAVASLAIVLALLYGDLLEAESAAVATPAAKPAAVAAKPAAVAPAAVAKPAAAVAQPASPGSPAPRSPAVPVAPSGQRNAAGPSAAPASAAGLSAAGPSSARTDDAALTARIEDLLARAPGLSHFELLGVAEAVTPEALASAYLTRMREFHPDRIAGRGLRELAVKAAALVARINEANGVLSDPKRRAAYLASRGPGAPSADLARAILSAEDNFRKGETALRRGDYANAAAAFAAAASDGPDEPIYRAYAAWCRFASPGAPKDRLVRETLTLLQEVAKERPKFALALHWQGQLYKHLGDASAAEAAFRAAVSEDKSLVDAERELRVLEMRRTKAAAAAAVEKASTGSGTMTATKSSGRPGFLKR
jgi:curved DNA-binding protein CbpA